MGGGIILIIRLNLLNKIQPYVINIYGFKNDEIIFKPKENLKNTQIDAILNLSNLKDQIISFKNVYNYDLKDKLVQFINFKPYYFNNETSFINYSKIVVSYLLFDKNLNQDPVIKKVVLNKFKNYKINIFSKIDFNYLNILSSHLKNYQTFLDYFNVFIFANYEINYQTIINDFKFNQLDSNIYQIKTKGIKVIRYPFPDSTWCDPN